jgi:hypothetical protein
MIIIFTKRGHTYIVNTRETDKQGKLIADEKASPAQLPPVEFGNAWKIPGFYTTSEVESILLRYKMAADGHDVGHKIDSPNPFDKYINLLRKSDR